MGFHIANDPAADQVLDEHAFAPLVGMMLDQQYGMEHAFRGPWKVLTRFGTLDPAAIAGADPEAFTALCSVPPAIHRFPAGGLPSHVNAFNRHLLARIGLLVATTPP